MTQWTGDDFQDYCSLLLRKRNAAADEHDLQIVPDNDKGDLGIEAFTTKGAAFQCYAPEEPLTTQARYEKQRDKLTTDLNKLKNRAEKFEELLGTVKINRYVFMVPRHDSKQLIAHAQNKAKEVREWGLSFIASEFFVVIETLDDYAVESEHLHAVPSQIFAGEPPEPVQRQEWMGGNLSLTSIADAKLKRILPADGEREGALVTLIDFYLAGENSLEHLRETLPDVYKAVVRVRSQHESLLKLRHPASSNTSLSDMTVVVDELCEAIVAGCGVVNKDDADQLAWAAIADWLMRCPLDFGEAVA
jgi:hypothetical protein